MDWTPVILYVLFGRTVIPINRKKLISFLFELDYIFYFTYSKLERMKRINDFSKQKNLWKKKLNKFEMTKCIISKYFLLFVCFFGQN